MPYTFPRSAEPYLDVTPGLVEGQCSECGQSDLKRYPVLSEGGSQNIVKCQSSAYSASLERGPRMGSIEILSDVLR